jgi:hypothetical protein
MKQYILIFILCAGCASEHQENDLTQSVVEQADLPEVIADEEDAAEETVDLQNYSNNDNKYDQLANEDLTFPDQPLDLPVVKSQAQSDKKTIEQTIKPLNKLESPPVQREPAHAIAAEYQSIFVYLKSPLLIMTLSILFLHYALSRYNNKKAAVIKKAMSDLKSLE